jgi:hypothetical protein
VKVPDLVRGVDHAADVLESRLDGSMPDGLVSLERAAQEALDAMRALVAEIPVDLRREDDEFVFTDKARAALAASLETWRGPICAACDGIMLRIDHPGDSWVYECARGHRLVVGK